MMTPIGAPFSKSSPQVVEPFNCFCCLWCLMRALGLHFTTVGKVVRRGG